MTGFRDMSRIKKVWESTTRYFRRTDSTNLKGKAEKAAADGVISIPFWRQKPVYLVAGAVILLGITAVAMIGAQQRALYVENNTFNFYHVYLNGEEVGTVDSPKAVYQLIEKKTEEVVNGNPGVRMVLETGDITYESDRAFQAAPETEATLAKLESSFVSYAQGVELKIDGKVFGIVKDQETADSILARVQSRFVPELANGGKEVRSVTTLSYNQNGDEEEISTETDLSDPGRVVTEVGFVEDVSIDTINIDPDQIDDGEEIYKKIMDGSTKPVTYVVQKGDCIGCIAQKFEISSQVIYENNPWIQGDRITVGDELDLTVLQPELTVQATESIVEIVSFSAPVEYVQNDKLRVGQTKTIKQGVDGTQRLTYKIVKQNGYIISEELVDKEVIKEPVAAVVEKGTMVVLGEGSGKFSNPVRNSKLTSKFGQRWGRMHNGIDLTGDKNIRASDAGTIEYVGWKSGLGNTVIIDHKNGYKTVYGHLSSFKVSKGDKVEKGDIIAIMGNTGNSTGTHLHFEIHKNGVPQNPLSYL